MWYTLEEKKPDNMQNCIILIDNTPFKAFYTEFSDNFAIFELPWATVDVKTRKEILWTPFPKINQDKQNEDKKTN